MPCGATYQLGRGDDLYNWLEEQVDADTGRQVLLWLLDFCAGPYDSPDALEVPGASSARRTALVPSSRVVLQLLIVDQYHVVQYLDAFRL